MAKNVFLSVDFLDAGPFKNTKRYRLRQTMADDGSDMDDVLTAVGATVTAIDALTMDHIETVRIEIELPQSGAAANVAANNNVEAFIAQTTDTTFQKVHTIIPAWDDVTYDKAPNNLLSAAFMLVFDALNLLICDVKSGETMTPEFGQSRGVKRGQRLVKRSS